LYAGAFCQLTIGRIGWSVLCSLMRPLIVGFVGFKFLYFHLLSGPMSVVLFIVFLICPWNVFVGFVLVVWKLLFMRFWIFCLYCIGSITMELPLRTLP